MLTDLLNYRINYRATEGCNMEKIILIRFGEIFLKGNNRKYFEKRLIDNIKDSLHAYQFDFRTSQNRYYIENYDADLETEIVNRLKKVFGIHSVSVAAKIPTEPDEIRKAAVEFFDDTPLTFRVTVRRADKKFPYESPTFAAEIGGDILDKYPETSVDLYKFDKELYVDIRENGYTYIFTDKILCAGGMPVGCGGKGLCLLSGGIDSPVAAYMMAKRGLSIDALHFHSMPYTSEQAKEKVVTLAKEVAAYAGKIHLFVVPFTEIQENIHKFCPPEYMITIMRRIMMRIAERVARRNSCGALITGESLGQVASQTMQSITVTNAVIENLPVFRPLIGFDKDEIIEIAQKIGTFETSILPYQDCCTIFLPKNPVIRPKLELIEYAEEKLDVEGLVKKAIENIEYIEIRP